MSFFWCWTLLVLMWALFDRQVLCIETGTPRKNLCQFVAVTALGVCAWFPTLLVVIGFGAALVCSFLALFTDAFSDDYQELALILILTGLLLCALGAYQLNGRLW